LGSSDEPKPDTLAWLEQKLEYIDSTLEDSLRVKVTERDAIVARIFESKNSVVRFYSELKKSVEERLRAVRTDGFEIQIDASFVVDRDFRRQFLNHVDQRKRGPYRNDMDAQQE